MQSCNRSGILLAANGVQLTVVLYGLAFVSSEGAALHCSDPSAIDLFVSQADRVLVIKAGGYQSGDKCASLVEVLFDR